MGTERLKSHLHWPLIGTALILVAVGIINLHSATYELVRGGVSGLVWSQLLWLGIGSAIGLVILLIDYRVFIPIAYPVFGISLILLLLVVFFGKTVAGNRNWLEIGFVTIQPSEFSKLALVMVLARYLADNPPARYAYSLRELIIPGLIVGSPLALIVAGHDMGSALLFACLSASMLLFAGIRREVLLILMALSIVSGAVMYRYALSAHQRSRIEAFLEPGADPRGKGYHVLQSKITVGSGRLLGKGYLKGMHSKLLYLPEKHTDFVFPVLAEEWGFVGAASVVGLYGVLLFLGFQTASKARDRFGVLLGLGISLIFFWQVTINLGGVLGLMPLTGVTLPLLSYGGSSLVTVLMSIGLLLNIWMRRFMF